MKPYKLLHKPSGLYYQPKKHRGSNLSKRGKIYQTKTNILTIGHYSDGGKRKTLTVYACGNTHIFKAFRDFFNWQKLNYAYNEYSAETKAEDWQIVEI